MSAFTLARWFTAPVNANGSHDDVQREEVLSEVYQASIVAVSGSTTMVKTPNGVVAIERKADLVDFDYVADTTWTHIRFWMNASSVKDLGHVLRSKPRGDFDSLFTHGRSR